MLHSYSVRQLSSKIGIKKQSKKKEKGIYCKKYVPFLCYVGEETSCQKIKIVMKLSMEKSILI